MIRPLGAFLLVLPAAAAFLSAPAQAQSYNAGLPADQSPAVSERPLPPRGNWFYGDDNAQAARGSQQAQQYGQGRAPNRGQLYPNEQADAAALPRPGFAIPNVIRPPAAIGAAPQAAPPAATSALPPEDQPEQGQPKELPSNLRRQLVNFTTKEPAGTIIIDTQDTYLYLVLGKGKALRYGIGVGREGFTWSGTERVSKMKEWPDWFPPPEMIERQPYLPRMMAGGPGNPLGARALYLGHTLYRIHGTNQPSTIGKFVSSGCIRLLNKDIEDLYSRVQVGSRVVVLPGKRSETVANSGSAPGSGASATRASVMVEPAGTGVAVSSSPLPAPR
jgi:lipoprotein-anchoring transpeptidase ErfK/SrfK